MKSQQLTPPKKPLYILCGFLILVLVAGSFLLHRAAQPPYLIFLSGAGMKAPVIEIATKFEKKTGIKVRPHFEGSSILRDYIINFKTGDLFLPGDQKNLAILEEKGLIKRKEFLAWHIIAILVSPHATDKISSLDDLSKPGIRLAISNPRQASLGRLVMKKIINTHPKGQAILDNVKVYGSSSQDVLRLYQKGDIDAVIEWDVMADTPQGKGLIKVPLEGQYQVKDPLIAGLLNTSKHPKLAEKFLKYLTTTGREIFRKHGYNIDGGDK